jgi:hypothetical protein
MEKEKSGLFHGFMVTDLLERDPRYLCAVLGAQLTLTNQVLETALQELRNLSHDQKQFENDVIQVAKNAGLITESKPAENK